jgi:hypothetical protein
MPLGVRSLGTKPLGTMALGTMALGTKPLGTMALGTSPQPVSNELATSTVEVPQSNVSSPEFPVRSTGLFNEN